MRIQSSLCVCVMLILLLVAVHEVSAQQNLPHDAGAAYTPPVTTMATIAANKAITDATRKERLVAGLGLKGFEEPGDAGCQDKGCLEMGVNRCIANACGQDGSKDPSACFPLKKNQVQAANQLICNAVNSPSSENRKKLAELFKDKEADILPVIALVQAIRGSSVGCQQVVKDFVGPYGKEWTKDFFILMSGCRIVTKERTREDEEVDFTTWIDVDSARKHVRSYSIRKCIMPAVPLERFHR